MALAGIKGIREHVDRPALAGRVASFEHHHQPLAGFLDPARSVAQLMQERLKRVLIFPLLESPHAHAPKDAMTSRQRHPTFIMMTKANEPSADVTLIYDGECPVCTAYSCNVDAGPASLRRVNARAMTPEVQRALEAGFDLDEGMVVVHDGQLYHGADAMHRMALLAPKAGIRNRLNRLLFGNLSIARAVYPGLRAGRNLLLKMLGRKKIGSLDKQASAD